MKTPSGEIISTLRKRSPSCLIAIVNDSDDFAVYFPNNSIEEEGFNYGGGLIP